MPFSVQSFLYDFAKNAFDAGFLWLPAVLAFFAWKLWIYHIRLRHISNINWLMLEIKLPREINKNPQAFEFLLNMLHQTKGINFYEKYLYGEVRKWFSLELVSKEGVVHFYIYAPSNYRKMIETQIYGQYPGIEITEVYDYTKDFADFNEYKMHMAEFILEKEDAYPIKTYLDYKLDKTETEEEFKNNPLTSFIELIGSIKEGEHVWCQILARATYVKWKDAGKKLVDKIMKRDEKKKEGEKIDLGAMRLSPGEHLITESIERNVSKLGFDVCIRIGYLAKEDKYNSIIPSAIYGAMKQYNSLNLNGFKRINATSYVDYFFKKTREDWRKGRIFDAYRNRFCFYLTWALSRKTFVLNSEELATIYHFPGKVATTPTLGRIEAKKGEPPAGLPI